MLPEFFLFFSTEAEKSKFLYKNLPVLKYWLSLMKKESTLRIKQNPPAPSARGPQDSTLKSTLSVWGSSWCSRKTQASESADYGLNPGTALCIALDWLKREVSRPLKPHVSHWQHGNDERLRSAELSRCLQDDVYKAPQGTQEAGEGGLAVFCSDSGDFPAAAGLRWLEADEREH